MRLPIPQMKATGMAVAQQSTAPTKAEEVFELRGVPADKVAQVLDDFVSEGPSAVEKEQQPDS